MQMAQVDIGYAIGATVSDHFPATLSHVPRLCFPQRNRKLRQTIRVRHRALMIYR